MPLLKLAHHVHIFKMKILKNLIFQLLQAFSESLNSFEIILNIFSLSKTVTSFPEKLIVHSAICNCSNIYYFFWILEMVVKEIQLNSSQVYAHTNVHLNVFFLFVIYDMPQIFFDIDT